MMFRVHTQKRRLKFLRRRFCIYKSDFVQHKWDIGFPNSYL